MVDPDPRHNFTVEKYTELKLTLSKRFRIFNSFMSSL